MEHLRTKEGGVRWEETERGGKKERLSVRERCELQSYGHREREREGG